eukprot:Opistho-2@57983
MACRSNGCLKGSWMPLRTMQSSKSEFLAIRYRKPKMPFTVADANCVASRAEFGDDHRCCASSISMADASPSGPPLLAVAPSTRRNTPSTDAANDRRRESASHNRIGSSDAECGESLPAGILPCMHSGHSARVALSTALIPRQTSSSNASRALSPRALASSDAARTKSTTPPSIDGAARGPVGLTGAPAAAQATDSVGSAGRRAVRAARRTANTPAPPASAKQPSRARSSRAKVSQPRKSDSHDKRTRRRYCSAVISPDDARSATSAYTAATASSRSCTCVACRPCSTCAPTRPPNACMPRARALRPNRPGANRRPR